MKRIFSIALLLGIVSVFFTSCGDKFVYQNTLEFPDQKWDRIEKGKDISFEKINITNIKDVYDINVSFSHTKNINVDEIIGDHQCDFRRNRSTIGQIFYSTNNGEKMGV